MIDIQLLRNKPWIFREAARLKGIPFDVDKFLELDRKLRETKAEFENKRAEQKKLSKEFEQAKELERSDLLPRLKSLAEEVKQLDRSLINLEKEWQEQLLFCPNPPLPETPVGKDESENVEIKRWGTPVFSNINHRDILTAFKLLDFESAVRISGSKFYFMRGQLALLHHAILQAGIHFLISKGFELVEPPHLVNEFAMDGTGYFPLGREQTYHIDENTKALFLIGTSEVPLCALYSDKILNVSDLPIKLAGYSPCYRREAGSYGKETAGLYRVHQFYKVEQVIICEPDPERSLEMHELLLQNSEEFVQALELPYRVVLVCTGDLGLGQVYKHDIECWMPSRNAYGETHSCSSLHSFQSRRLNIKVKRDERVEYVFTLNNTLVASPRILISYIENHFKDGRIYLSPVLRKYFEGKEYIDLNSS
ncbi:MAG: serine--tRNA ligase [Deltaproteobacteria bacterium]|nr:serine--tRNA ligase [Deltaproteobacteria bacterium]